MKRLFAITVVVLLSSAMFVVVDSARADMNENSSAAVPRPFMGRWSGAGNFLPGDSSCPGGAIAIATAKGTLTLTGLSEFVGTYCCNFTTGHCTGTGVLTAANGDALYFTMTQDFNPATGDFTELEVFTGGTGRFVGATGTSTTSGTTTFMSPTSDVWEASTEGEITF